MAESLSPLEAEREEFGRDLQEIRGYSLRIIHIPPATDSTKCVFFFHGGGGRGCQFKHQIRTLKDKVHIVATDYLGHGDSPAPDTPELYTPDEHLASTYEVFTKYKKADNYIVCHCYGAIHTLRLLKQLRDEGAHSSIKGIIILSLGTICPIKGITKSFLSIPAFIQEWLRPLARSSSNAQLFAAGADPNLIAFENSVTDNNRMYMMRVIGTGCSNQDQWTQWLQHGKEGIANEIPLMLIIGEEDGVFSTESSSQLVDFFGFDNKMFHVVSGASHLLMLEKPDVINEHITNFIENN